MDPHFTHDRHMSHFNLSSKDEASGPFRGCARDLTGISPGHLPAPHLHWTHSWQTRRTTLPRKPKNEGGKYGPKEDRQRDHRPCDGNKRLSWRGVVQEAKTHPGLSRQKRRKFVLPSPETSHLLVLLSGSSFNLRIANSKIQAEKEPKRER